MCSTYQVIIPVFWQTPRPSYVDAASSRNINPWFYRQYTALCKNILTYQIKIRQFMHKQPCFITLIY